MAIYGREKNQFMDFTFHFMDRVSFLTGFWRFGESMDELNGKLLLPRPENCFCTGLEGLAEQLQFAETGVDVSSLPESRRTNLIPKPSLARAGES